MNPNDISTQTPETKKPNFKLRRIFVALGAVAATASILSGTKAIFNAAENIHSNLDQANKSPFEVSGTVMHHVQRDDTVWDIVNNAIATEKIRVKDNIDNRDVINYIEDMPSNADAISDTGNLNIGADLEMPATIEKAK